ncbi:MAG: hypothetical protein A2162_06740 [Deltaproteobacteria bacterium RBG_13_52_11b]|nr:MAG: hypothetical protein A2162_06740 [Deltaproteobacteria bacterium RBG_13_52_11b]
MTLQFQVGEMEPIKVVARYANGTVIKGFTQDFFPNKDRFHVTPADRPPGGTIEVFVKRLKAVFVVRDFQGDPYYNEQKVFVKGESLSGLKLEVTFSDGEVLVGSTALGYDPKRQGNFLIPADQMSNNTRVFAVSSAVKSVRQLYDHLIEDDHSRPGKA